MQIPMTKKTRRTLLAGFLVFVVGGSGAAYLGTRGRVNPTARADQAQVFYAVGALDPGTSAASAVAQGLIRTRTVALAALPANAVTDTTQLSGRVAGASIPSGAILTTDMFPAPQTRIGTVVIPAGKRALTLKLEPVRGISGFAGGGDHIDVYSVVQPSETRPAGVQLILQSVEVLNVNGVGLPPTAGQPGGPELVYLLAVTPGQAERLIYLTEFEKLYFDLVPKGEAPVTTPGAGPTQALQTL
jgi:pilus assembly protein CpaB